MTASYFTREERDGAEWLRPTELAGGPWDPGACHGGPPTAALVRALERAVPAQRLARVSVELSTPVPMAGFGVEAGAVRTGRATSQSAARLVDAEGRVRATATGIHVRAAEEPVVPGTLDNRGAELPVVAGTTPGSFPLHSSMASWVGFPRSVEVRYPPGSSDAGGATTVYLRPVATTLPDEVPSPFQRIALLADCGNAFSRHADPDELQFMNTDLVIALARDPAGEWLGSRSTSQWEPGGVGLADALLFDEHGPVGRALQTLLLRPVPGREVAAG